MKKLLFYFNILVVFYVINYKPLASTNYCNILFPDYPNKIIKSAHKLMYIIG